MNGGMVFGFPLLEMVYIPIEFMKGILYVGSSHHNPIGSSLEGLLDSH